MDIIIGVGNNKLKIGTIINGEYELTNNTKIPMTFKIIEKATYKDWLEYRLKEGRPYNYDKNVDGEFYFYKVITD
jgi:hypothetical protein